MKYYKIEGGMTDSVHSENNVDESILNFPKLINTVCADSI